MMVDGEVTTAPSVVDILTSAQLQKRRKGFELNVELCSIVGDTPKLGECAEYSADEAKHLNGENGLLCKYFPYQYRTEKTQKKSNRPNARDNGVEFIRLYGCSNNSKTGCKCKLWTARVQDAILVYEGVGENGVPFKHVHHCVDMSTGMGNKDKCTTETKKTTTMTDTSPSDGVAQLSRSLANLSPSKTPTRIAHKPAKQPNPSGSPTGTLRRAKNAKRTASSSAGDVTDVPLPTTDEGVKFDSADDKLLQALFCGTCDVHVPQPAYTITEGSVFDGPSELFSTVLRLFKSGGMLKSSLGKKNKRSMTSAELEKTPWGDCVFIDPRDESKSEIPSRGRLFCKHPNCRWCVPFSYIKANQVYEIRSGKDTNKSYHNHLCLEHNHPPDKEDTGVDGYMEIKHKNDLTADEMNLLCSCARLNSRMPSIQHAMSNAYGRENKRSYDSNLLRREVDRFKKKLFGTDEHRMKEFMDRGNHAKSNGGSFDFNVSSTMTMTGTFFASPLMTKYARQYGGYFCITDGTFGTNKYGLTAMPWTGCCCLGLTHCIGISTGLSENSADAIKAGRTFHLSSTLGMNEKIDELTVSNMNH